MGLLSTQLLEEAGQPSCLALLWVEVQLALSVKYTDLSHTALWTQQTDGAKEIRRHYPAPLIPEAYRWTGSFYP